MEGAYELIIPKSVFERAAEEMWLRGQETGPGGNHFGSRRALNGRGFCPCGAKMTLMRRKEPVWLCKSCGRTYAPGDVQRQVTEAILKLPQMTDEITTKIDELKGDLSSENRHVRAAALRREWQLKCLLPIEESVSWIPACYDETDFLARTSRRGSAFWNGEVVVGILSRVVAGEVTEFRGGLRVVSIRDDS